MISPLLSLTMNNPSDVLDMPVDPNEPTYCLCHQVSYGEMIGCDNLDVSMSSDFSRNVSTVLPLYIAATIIHPLGAKVCVC